MRYGQGASVHSALVDQGDANWAWWRGVSPRKAESAILDRSKGGAEFVVCVVRETTRAEEELGLQIRGFKRSGPKTKRGPLLAKDGDERTNFLG